MASQYSPAQIICGLKLIWEDLTGGDEPDFESETRIDLYMMADGTWKEVDFADIIFVIERFFGFSCHKEEWVSFFRFDIAKHDPEEWKVSIAPMLTFGALAQFIAERAPVIAKFQPMKILGVSCESAGVFLGIQKVANEAASRELQLAPSTRISDALKGNRLSKFWEKLDWLTESSIPELPVFWGSPSHWLGCLMFLMFGTGIVASCCVPSPALKTCLLLVPSSFYAVAFLCKRKANPLPEGIVTFRDLSMWIINHRS